MIDVISMTETCPYVKNSIIRLIYRLKLLSDVDIGLECKISFDQIYVSCVSNCQESDAVCIASCARDYDASIKTCPCEEGCLDGCPCPTYQCPALKNKPILVLSTYAQESLPIIINQDTDNFYFEFEQRTEAYGSCSVTWQNKHFIFGGDKDKRQISQVNGCQLERVGTLKFGHTRGACANVLNKTVYLCFDWNSTKKCLKSDHPLGDFEPTENSQYRHGYTRVASSQSKRYAKSLSLNKT